VILLGCRIAQVESSDCAARLRVCDAFLGSQLAVPQPRVNLITRPLESCLESAMLVIKHETGSLASGGHY